MSFRSKNSTISGWYHWKDFQRKFPLTDGTNRWQSLRQAVLGYLVNGKHSGELWPFRVCQTEAVWIFIGSPSLFHFYVSVAAKSQVNWSILLESQVQGSCNSKQFYPSQAGIPSTWFWAFKHAHETVLVWGNNGLARSRVQKIDKKRHNSPLSWHSCQKISTDEANIGIKWIESGQKHDRNLSGTITTVSEAHRNPVWIRKEHHRWSSLKTRQ